MQLDNEHIVNSLEQLAEIYGQPSERARLKEITQLDAYCRDFIAASPFVLLATFGADGADCSPRGDMQGFVVVEDAKTLLLPDRPGNKRVDSLKNIVQNTAVGLLFLVPGINITLRVNGQAQISVAPDLLNRFAVEGNLPKAVLVVTVQQIFIQCPRALVRSDLWNPAQHLKSDELPSAGTILAAHTCGKVNAAEYDAQEERILYQTLY